MKNATPMNTCASHTPGPWTAQYEAGQFFFLNGPDGSPVMRQRGGMLPARVDARLIAAAPRMRDELERTAYQVCPRYETCDHPDCERRRTILRDVEP